MNFIEKLKKDKKFRRIVGIIVLFIIFLNYRGQQQAVSEEYCNSLITGSITTVTEYNACKSTPGCYAWARNSGNWPLGLDDVGTCLGKLLSLSVADGCTSAAENGQFVMGVQDVGCKSGYSIEQGLLCGDRMYRCQAPPPGLECEESWQKSLSKMIPFNFARGWGCEGRAYAAIGIIVFAVLMVM